MGYVQRRKSSGELSSHVGGVNERKREILDLKKDFGKEQTRRFEGKGK